MRRNRVTLVCRQCKNPFEVPSCRREAKFCSKTCYHKWQKGRVFRTTLPSDVIAQTYESGTSVADLAEQYDVTVQAIYHHLHKVGIALRHDRHYPVHLIGQTYLTGQDHHGWIDLPTEEIGELYRAGQSLTIIAGKYDVSVPTIHRRLKAIGVEMRRAGWHHRRRCPDGHIADGNYEYEVDRWLSSHSIPHEINPIVPWWTGGKSPMRADFKVGLGYIEVWATVRNKSYDLRRQKKLRLYQQHDVLLYSIFPHHVLDDDYSVLNPLLEYASSD